MRIWPVRGSCSRCSESVWPMPWMIPPSIWLDAPSGSMTRRLVHRCDAVDPDLTGLDVDRHLGNLHAEGQHLHAGRVRPRPPLPRICASSSSPTTSRERRVRRPALLRDLLDLAPRVRGRGAHGGPHRGRRRRTGRDRRERPASRVAERDGHVLERDPELLRCDLRHRGACARADVLHRRDDGRASVRADAHPRIARRPAAAVPDLRRHADTALDRLRRARADLVPALPVRLRAPVALEQVLAAVRALVCCVVVGVVAAAQLERVDLELGGEHVEQRLEPERPLDEPGRAERLHRRLVDLRARRRGADVLAGVEHLHRALDREDQPPQPVALT